PEPLGTRAVRRVDCPAIPPLEPSRGEREEDSPMLDLLIKNARIVDGTGSPSFVDPHTHYDAQIAWDPMVTCSPWHGVTTVIMGNCGVGVAPVKPTTREILMQDLVNVEAIPYDVMKAGIDWQWESYGEYLDAIDRRGLGINVAGLVAFTPLRHYVM